VSVGADGRLIVVLGSSDRHTDGLHPICAARLRHAATLADTRDVVVLSGWARAAHGRSEAELMAAGWTGTCRELVVDPEARHTVENALNALDDLERTGATTVIVVTSRFHAQRARAVFAYLTRRQRPTIVVSSPPARRPLQPWLREFPCWAVLPFQLMAARRRPARAP